MPSIFGKKPARHDARTLHLGAILNSAALPPLPDQYDFDDTHPTLPTPPPPLGNLAHPCCVISGRGHQTIRFELSEQGVLPDLTEADVLAEWRKETNGAEEGLYVLDSLKLWRKEGWRAAGKKYDITAFAKVDPTDRERMKTAIYLFDGIGLGVALPFSVTQNLDSTAPWSVPLDPAHAKRDPHGGHYVLLTGYDDTGPVCVTWGRKQSMTWEFVNRYADEAYAIIDGVDDWLGTNSPINVESLIQYLKVVGTMM